MRAERQTGLSLIEILVAFVIMAMAVSVLLKIFSSGLINVGVSNQYLLATTLAESRLAALDPMLDPDELGGSGQSGDFHWRLTAEPANTGLDESQLTAPVSAYRVRVVVSWMDGSRERNINLSVMRLFNTGKSSRRG